MCNDVLGGGVAKGGRYTFQPRAGGGDDDDDDFHDDDDDDDDDAQRREG